MGRSGKVRGLCPIKCHPNRTTGNRTMVKKWAYTQGFPWLSFSFHCFVWILETLRLILISSDSTLTVDTSMYITTIECDQCRDSDDESICRQSADVALSERLPGRLLSYLQSQAEILAIGWCSEGRQKQGMVHYTHIYLEHWRKVGFWLKMSILGFKTAKTLDFLFTA